MTLRGNRIVLSHPSHINKSVARVGHPLGSGECESRMADAWGLLRLVGEGAFVGEDAIEGGAADGELAGGAELVAAIEVEDEVDMLADDGVEREIGDAGDLRVKHGRTA